MTLNPTDYKIRQAEISDAAAIATIHVNAWRIAYRNIIDPTYLHYSLSVEDRLSYWREKLMMSRLKGAKFMIFVSVLPHPIHHDREKPVGFIAVGPVNKKILPARGQIHGLYLNPDFRSRGIGTRLFQKGRHFLKQNGLGQFCAWTLEKNSTARSFYEYHAGILDENIHDILHIGGQTYRNVLYCWHNLMEQAGS